MTTGSPAPKGASYRDRVEASRVPLGAVFLTGRDPTGRRAGDSWASLADKNGIIRWPHGGSMLALSISDIHRHGPVAAVNMAIEGAGLVPERTPRKRARTALYRHLDAKGRLLYVGISRSAAARLAGHQRSAWDTQIARVEVEHYPTRESALAAEREAIRTERPLFNKQHAPRPSTRRHSADVVSIRCGIFD